MRAMRYPLVKGIAAGIAVITLAGCASATLRTARDELAAGRYAEAHQKLLIARNDPNLSSYHRREIDNDICLTEEKMGAPGYPVAEQLSVCERAADEGADQSKQILAQIQDTQRGSLVKQIDSSIAAGDVAQAVDGISRYRQIAGADPNQIAKWSQQLWTVVDQQNGEVTRAQRSAIKSTIAQLKKEHPKIHRMSDEAFASWVKQNLNTAGAPNIAQVAIAKQTLMLQLPSDQLAAAAINLDILAKINDGMVARCGCDGRTKVALQDTQLPAYLVRLDPATRKSEVLVLARY